jgi:hypothetical protein
LVEPVDVESQYKVGNYFGNYEDTPIGKKDYVPREETGKDF